MRSLKFNRILKMPESISTAWPWRADYLQETQTLRDAHKPKLLAKVWQGRLLIWESELAAFTQDFPGLKPNPCLQGAPEGIENGRNLGQWIESACPVATGAPTRALGVACFMASFYWGNYRTCHCIKLCSFNYCVRPTSHFNWEMSHFKLSSVVC